MENFQSEERSDKKAFCRILGNGFTFFKLASYSRRACLKLATPTSSKQGSNRAEDKQARQENIPISSKLYLLFQTLSISKLFFKKSIFLCHLFCYTEFSFIFASLAIERDSDNGFISF